MDRFTALPGPEIQAHHRAPAGVRSPGLPDHRPVPPQSEQDLPQTIPEHLCRGQVVTSSPVTTVIPCDFQMCASVISQNHQASNINDPIYFHFRRNHGKYLTTAPSFCPFLLVFISPLFLLPLDA